MDTGQDTGTLRVTIREAVARLGVSEADIRKRIQRGSLEKEMGTDGRVYVYLGLSQDMSHPESQVHRDPVVEDLVEELRGRGAQRPGGIIRACAGAEERRGRALPADRRGPHAGQQPARLTPSGVRGPQEPSGAPVTATEDTER